MFKRIISFLIALVFVCSAMPSSAYAAMQTTSRSKLQETPQTPQILTVPRNQQIALTAETEAAQTWQISNGTDWIDIQGVEGHVCHLRYAMCRNMMDAESHSLIRCLDEQGQAVGLYEVQFVEPEIHKEVFNPVFQVVSDQLRPVDPLPEAAAPPVLALSPAPGAGTPLHSPAEPQADALPAADVPYMVTIQYRNEVGEQVLSPWQKVLRDAGDNQTVYFPSIQGYAAYVDCTWNEETQRWEGGTQAVELSLDYNSFTEDPTYEVIYKPAQVSYMVQRHFQNSTDDEYTTSSEVKYGLTGTPIDMASLAEPTPGYASGFIAMWFDEPHILASGSAVADIFYDRLYYLMNFDLDGGYGAEPIYARFGSPLLVPTPIKPGYQFGGWTDPTASDPDAVVSLPSAMPDRSSQYKAKWIPNDMAEATVMIWGENPNRPGTYEYMSSSTIQAKPGETVDLQTTSFLICGQTEHTHSAACCTKEAHTHGPECYSTPCTRSGHPKNPKHGDRYAHKIIGITLASCIYDANRKGWFQTDSGPNCGKTAHTHGDGSCTCPIPEHRHTADCYSNQLDANLWTFVKQDHPVVNPDGTTVINGYYDRTSFTIHFRNTNSSKDDFGSITAKWGADIQQSFKEISQKAGTNNWSEQKNGKSPWTANVQIMPSQDRTYYKPPSSSGSSTAYYKGLKLGGDPTKLADYTVELLTSKVNGSNLTVSVEDFLSFDGYTRNEKIGAKNGDRFQGAIFYYTRNNYSISFYSGNTTVKTVEAPYEASIADQFSYIPPYPENLETGGYQFDGWYADPSFREESKLDNTMPGLKMPAANLTVYAKWSLVTHTVRTFTTEQDWLDAQSGTAPEGQPLETLTPLHGQNVNITVYPDRTAEKLNFVGWFYRDSLGNEVAFDNQNMPVRRDLDLYAKWTSKTMVPFKIHYQLADGTPVAPPTQGQTIAGSVKTFYPKVNLELDPAYRIGYFPQQSNHRMEMGTDPSVVQEYTFLYRIQEVPISYTVRYLEQGTQKELHAPKQAQTSRPIVYEDFVPISGYVPDAYSKKLYISARPQSNVITFWYTKDSAHAQIRKSHWVERLTPVDFPSGEAAPFENRYELYSTETALLGDLDTKITIETLEIPGFSPAANPEGTVTEGILTEKGLHLMRFYDRNRYPYEVRYLEYGTNHPIVQGGTEIPPDKATAPYEALISCTPKELDGWLCKNPTPYEMKIGIEQSDSAKNNIYTFFYTKIQQTCALTIRKSGWEEIDENQSFLFEVTGPQGSDTPLELTVSVVGNGSVTIQELPAGTYTVRELTDWSWRYCPEQPSYTIELTADYVLNVVNTRKEVKWLNAMAWKPNSFAIRTKHKESGEGGGAE